MQKNLVDFEVILRTLNRHKVDFIVVGGVCAVFHGAPVQTFDLDVVHSRDSANLDRLEAALTELGAHYREHTNKRLVPVAARMGTLGHHLLQTTAGPLDVLGGIAKQRDYERLLPSSSKYVIDDDLTVWILNLAELIETKQETGRTKDLLVLPVLRRLQDEVDAAEKGE